MTGENLEVDRLTNVANLVEDINAVVCETTPVRLETQRGLWYLITNEANLVLINGVTSGVIISRLKAHLQFIKPIIASEALEDAKCRGLYPDSIAYRYIEQRAAIESGRGN
ncbi:hypothetical protein M0R72_10215 [Candidatus Pacearchaeota archaeon]|jgi:hypothetical protein|nr:hypothetical protein [Candidatus Pacearchaeota archaeon]